MPSRVQVPHQPPKLAIAAKSPGLPAIANGSIAARLRSARSHPVQNCVLSRTDPGPTTSADEGSAAPGLEVTIRVSPTPPATIAVPQATFVHRRSDAARSRAALSVLPPPSYSSRASKSSDAEPHGGTRRCDTGADCDEAPGAPTRARARGRRFGLGAARFESPAQAELPGRCAEIEVARSSRFDAHVPLGRGTVGPLELDALGARLEIHVQRNRLAVDRSHAHAPGGGLHFQPSQARSERVEALLGVRSLRRVEIAGSERARERIGSSIALSGLLPGDARVVGSLATRSETERGLEGLRGDAIFAPHVGFTAGLEQGRSFFLGARRVGSGGRAASTAPRSKQSGGSDASAHGFFP